MKNFTSKSLKYKEQRAAYNLAYQERNARKKLWHSAKNSSKKRGLEFTITEADVVIPMFCPYLGYRLTVVQGQGRLDTAASIDRIEATRGYVPGNIEVISLKANTMKNNATLGELRDFARAILKRWA